MGTNLKYIVYLTTNKVNKKIYVGVHETEDPYGWDYYLGDGAFSNKPSSYNKAKYPLHAAICKYGVNAFYRKTLQVFDTKQEALNLEAEIVDEEFIRREDTYNVVVGGGVPPIHNKKVYQFSTENELLHTYNSIKETALEYNCDVSTIRDCINDKRIFKDFFFSFESEIDITEFSYKTYRTNVNVYNDSGELLNSFNSVVEAGKFYDFDPRSISNAIYECCKLHGLIFCKSDTSVEDHFNKVKNRNIVVNTPIYKYNIETGDFIKSYNSVADAIRDCGLKNRSRIITAAKNAKTSGGFRWSYFKVDNILKTPMNLEPIKPKKIAQKSLENEIIKIWDIDDCRKQYPNCIKVCRGARNKAYGFK